MDAKIKEDPTPEDFGIRGDYVQKARYYAEFRVAAERERLLTLAKKRADHEASAAAHHTGRWHAAHEYHLERHVAMRDLIDALEGPNVRAKLPAVGGSA